MINYPNVSYDDVKEWRIDTDNIVNLIERQFGTSSNTFYETRILDNGYAYFRDSNDIPKDVLVFVKKSPTDDNPIPFGVNAIKITNGKYDIRNSLQAQAGFQDVVGEVSFSTDIVAICYYPFDNSGKVSLYNQYFVEGSFIDNPVAIQSVWESNQVILDGLQYNGNALINVPSGAGFLDNLANSGNNDAFNKAYDGNFSFAKINLPPQTNLTLNKINYGYKQNQIRDLDTRITKTIGYRVEFGQDGRLPDLLLDELAILQFTNITADYLINFASSYPRNFLSIFANGVLPNRRVIYIRLPGCGALRQRRQMILSFDAINSDTALSPDVNLIIGFTEYYNNNAYYRGSFNKQDLLSNSWRHYDFLLQQPSITPPLPDLLDSSFNNYTEIEIILPANQSSRIQITNIYLDYGNTPVVYPREPNYPDLKNYETLYSQIFASNGNFQAFIERPLDIVNRLSGDDTETTILADGRSIFKDDVFQWNDTDSSDNLLGQTILIPASKPNGRGIYDAIVRNNLPDNTPDTHVEYDDLSDILNNPTWAADARAMNITGVFYWRYQGFKPVCDFTTGSKNKDGTQAFEFIELHRSQNIPPEFSYKAFFQKDDNTKVWYGASTNNWLAEFEKKGGLLTSNTPKFSNETAPIEPKNLHPSENWFYLTAYNIYSLKEYSFCITQKSLPVTTTPNEYDCKYVQNGKQFGSIDVTQLNIQEAKVFAVSNDTANLTNGISQNTLSIMHFCYEYELYDGGIYKPSIQNIACKNTNFPNINNDFIISPDVLSKTLINNQNYINVYYQGDPNLAIGNLTATRGINIHGKKLASYYGIKNVPFYAVIFNQANFLLYSGTWIYFESKLQRTFKTKVLSIGKTKFTNETVPYNKICVYFQTGNDKPPVSASIPPDAIFIECDIGGLSDITSISRAFQKTINEFCVRVPNLQNSIQKSFGISDFDNPIENYSSIQNRNFDKTVFCDNFRNIGYKIPKNNIQQRDYSLHSATSGASSGTYHISNTYYSDQSNPYNLALVYTHVSLC